MRDFGEWLAATPLSSTIQSVDWIIPLLQSIHILMIGLVLVSIAMVALRVLGRVRTEQSLEHVWRRFAPWLWSALVVMTLTGVLLVVGEPLRQFLSVSFWLKMTLLALGVAIAVRFGRSIRLAAATGAGDSGLSSGTRFTAVAAVALWLAIIFLGRAIAYDVEVWGSLSLALRS